MPTKSTLLAGAAGLLVGGALLGPPIAGAASDADGPVPHTTRFGPRLGHGLHVAIDTAAEVIGVDEAELLDALRDGQSIAAVAEANGVDPQTVIDSLVVEATIRIQEAVDDGDLDAERAAELEAELPERIADAVDREGGFRWGPGERGGPARGHGPGAPGRIGFPMALDAAAEVIGVEVDELLGAMRDGQSIAEVAAANGAEAEAVVEAMLAELEAHLTDFVNG